MSNRSGYSEDCDGWSLICYRGAVASSIRGKRGQRLLRGMLATLDAMPVKELIAGDLIDEQGATCAFGALAVARGMEGVETIDTYDHEGLGALFDVAPALARELMYENDREDSMGVYAHGPLQHPWQMWQGRSAGIYVYGEPMTPALRWQRVREWVAAHVAEGAA